MDKGNIECNPLARHEQATRVLPLDMIIYETIALWTKSARFKEGVTFRQIMDQIVKQKLIVNGKQPQFAGVQSSLARLKRLGFLRADMIEKCSTGKPCYVYRTTRQKPKGIQDRYSKSFVGGSSDDTSAPVQL